jgi:diacylglycerol kinase
MPNNETKFSWRVRAKSFSYAWAGIRSLLKTEHNSRLHLAFTIIALLLGVLLKISRFEFITLIIVIALVWICEIFNTCVEKTMDFISLEQHPQIKLVKDLAAAAVLIMAMAALIVGGLIFIPKLV